MNIQLLICIGLACGLLAHSFNFVTHKATSLGAHRHRKNVPIVSDLMRGVIGACIGYFILNAGIITGTNMNFRELICAVGGGLYLVWVGRNINWFRGN